MQDILAVDLSASMLSILEKRYNASEPTLGNDLGEFLMCGCSTKIVASDFACMNCHCFPEQ